MLDYQYFKDILTIMVELNTPEFYHEDVLKKLYPEGSDTNKTNKYIKHIFLLADNGVLDVLDILERAPLNHKGGITAHKPLGQLYIDYDLSALPVRVTTTGYDFLAGLNNDTILNKLIDHGKEIAISEGISVTIALAKSAVNATLGNIFN